MSIDYLALTVGLGIVGFDAVPFLVAVAMIALGARRREVALYAVILLVIPIAVGAGLSRVLGPWLADFDFRSWSRTGIWPPIIEVLFALILLFAAWRRWRGAPSLLPRIPLPERLGWAAHAGLTIFALGGVLTDFSYLALLVASSKQSLVNVFIGQAIWVGVSEVLLIVALVLLLTAGRQRIVQLRESWESNVAVRRVWLTYSMVALALILLLDVGLLVVRGNYLWWD